MALYLIGDIQGCDGAFQHLLDEISFSPSRDTLFVLGDLVNRGPESATVLRRLMGYGDAAKCLLGNHDLHLLATAAGARKPGRKDTLAGVLKAPDCDMMLSWLRWQRMAYLLEHQDQTILMVHAGVLPTWTPAQTMALASEVETVLRGPDLNDFLHKMYGNKPTAWDSGLRGTARLRLIVNALTRLRFCTADGVMEFETSDGADAAPKNFMPWFDVPGRKTASVTVAFGHWSTLGWLDRANLLALDSGCVWGGCLSALQLGSGTSPHQLIQVKCEQAQKPGQ
jgi:bis(5'-nucleosyl)-tetraphosphatase (symmetrical)